MIFDMVAKYAAWTIMITAAYCSDCQISSCDNVKIYCKL